MLRNYMKVSVRNILRNKVYSFINIAGLAIGMAASILISLWIMDELNFNGFNKNLNRIFLIPQTQHYKNTADFTVSPTPIALAPFLKSAYPEIEYATRYDPYEGKALVSYGDKNFNEDITFADPDFFKIFTFTFIEGDPNTALNEPNSIVITKDVAEKYFGDKDPVGKMFRINEKYEFKVTGVIKNIPHNSDIQFTFLAPMKALEDYGVDLNDWGNNRLFTYVLLQKGVSYKTESQKIKTVLQNHTRSPAAGDLFLFPFKDYHLYSIAGSGGRIMSVRLFSIIALITLLTACINFMNLATARASKRTTEVGIKKVVGASRGQIAKQFFGEAFLLTLISSAFAIFLVELFLPVFNEMANKHLLLSKLSGSSIVLMIGIVVLTAVVSGIYPALYLSSFRPISIFRKAVDKRSGNFALRRVLLVFQFAISIFLIISTAVVVMQLHYLVNKDLGFDKENILYFSVDEGVRNNIEDIRNELLKNTNIKDVSCTSHIPFEVYSNGGGWSWEGKDTRQEVLISFLGVDYDFLRTFDVKLLDGRFFSPKFPSDTLNVVINQTFANIIGNGSIVGKVLSNGNFHSNIIGVVKDFNFTDLQTKTGPLLIYLTKSPNYVFVKVNSHLPEAISYIRGVYKKLNPAYPFQYHFLDQTYEQSFMSETRLSKIFNGFAILAIIISCLGLFGLASFVAEQKTKEIGMRKVLGASVLQIVKNLTLQFLSWVLLANVIAWPVAYYYLGNWLENYPYRIQMNVWIFIGSGLMALLIAAITVSLQALKAATANPVESLRYE